MVLPEETDVVPRLYSRIIKLLKTLTETATPAEQKRVFSASFLSGVIKLLTFDERMTIEPWELHNTPRPVREIKQAERDAERAYEREQQRSPR